MGLIGRLKVYTLVGGTRAIHIWRNMEIADELTAAGSSLILLDTKGEIPEEVLHEWLEDLELKRKEYEEEVK